MSPSAQDPAEAGPKTPEHQPERRPERQANSHSEAHPETHPESTTETTRETTETADADKDKPTSCLGCRRRKLKCSRDHPSCTHCQRLDATCVYDTKKAKPGMRPGAIEALNQRIEALENILASRGSTASTTPAPESSPSSASVVSILSVLAQELQKLNSASAHAAPAPAPAPLQIAATNGAAVHSISVVSPSSTNSPGTANGHAHSHSHGLDQGHNSRRKRRRMVDSCGNPDIDLARPLEDMAADFEDPSISPGLPPPETLQAVVNAYFLAVQPWIPVLHETQFRRRMHDADQRPRLACILHAMVVAAARYVQPDDLPDDVANDHLDGLLRLAQRSRSHVLLSAMDNLSVESLQALIILAFHDIGSGETTRAWSIVASLTRTVEYLGLADEDEEHQYHERGSQNGQQQPSQNPQQNQQQQAQKPQQQKDQESNSTPQPLLRPMTILGPPHNWIEEEERRRVFWCILLLDRFCSVATGWNTGLAGANVNRRLPADGYFFYKEEPVLTPYMNGPPAGAPDMALSHPLAHAPNATDRARERETADSPASPHNHGHNGHMNVGAFAYCIEAAESLSRVVSAFLRQSVDFGNRQDVSRWLTRFKELDLRLVHWKMYLPQRWRDSNVSRQPTLVNMDPNLTLAHITHNTSTILLHQSIAYPDPVWWTRIVKLPSFCSAETCQNAAIETATITNKYLRYTSKNSPVASQFAFCVYISARVLLVHWRSDGGETNANGHGNGNGNSNSVPDEGVLPEFWSLLRSLEDMDRRWIGSVGRLDPNKKSTSLAGHYAQHLKDLHRQCLASPSFVVDVLGYTEFEPKTPKATPPTTTSTRAPSAFVEPAVVQAAPVPVPEPTPTPAPAPTQLPQLPQVHPTWPLQPLDQLSPVMTTYHQHAHAQAQAMADNRAYAAASVVSVPTAHTDDLAAISHLLLDQQFMDRDRVISFEDSFFAAPGRWT